MAAFIALFDESVARFLKQATLEAGYSAEVVDDGLEGLKRAGSEPFDLVPLDIMLPSLDGLGGMSAAPRRTAANAALAHNIIASGRNGPES